jgi:hypothetical protein
MNIVHLVKTIRNSGHGKAAWNQAQGIQFKRTAFYRDISVVEVRADFIRCRGFGSRLLGA